MDRNDNYSGVSVLQRCVKTDTALDFRSRAGITAVFVDHRGETFFGDEVLPEPRSLEPVPQPKNWSPLDIVIRVPASPAGIEPGRSPMNILLIL